MTKEEILAMEAGRELNKLVATEVMGESMPEFIPEDALEFQLAGSPVKSPQGNWLCLCKYDEGDIPIWQPLSYSVDISVAWLVVEKLLNLGYQLEIYSLGALINDEFGIFSKGWTVHFSTWDNPKLPFEGGCAENLKAAPEAICKAALLTTLK